MPALEEVPRMEMDFIGVASGWKEIGARGELLKEIVGSGGDLAVWRR